MAEKIPAHIREQQINELPNISFVRWDGEYKNSKSKAICRCAVDGHEWSVQASSIINLGKCPKCGRVSGANWRRIPAEERIGQINGLPNISFVRWADEYRNEKSKAVCRCAVDGFEWAASISNLIGRRSGCPRCANRKIARDRRTPSHVWEKRINDMPTVEFVEWVGRHHGCDSKAVFRCAIDGHEWTTTMRSVASSMSGCPQCAGSRRFTAEERMAQINAKPNTEFVRWEGSYKNVHSRAVCRCTVDGFEWSSEINNLINSARGCPKCAKSGYNPSEHGTLYVLRSECGSMVKIGISNNYKRRHIELRRATPFAWSCIELIHSDDGGLIAEWEKELHSWTEQAEFREPFDGYTEWRKWDDRIPMWIEEYRARA